MVVGLDKNQLKLTNSIIMKILFQKKKKKKFIMKSVVYVVRILCYILQDVVQHFAILEDRK